MKAKISNSCFQLPSNLLNRLVKGTSPLSLEGYYYGYLTESRSGGAKKSKETESDNLIVYERGMGSCLCCGSAFAQQTTFVKRIEETRQYAVTGKAARSHENRLVNMHRQASITNDCCLL